MKIAVSVNEYNEIIPHLGKCNKFMIFTKEDETIELEEIITTDGKYSDHTIECIDGCDVVISGQIGMGMIKGLRKMRIRPYVETETVEPIEAIRKLY